MKNSKTRNKGTKDYYKQIDTAIRTYEEFKPYRPYKTEWICDRIVWCWKFRHITREQKDELMERMIEVFKIGIYD